MCNGKVETVCTVVSNRTAAKMHQSHNATGVVNCHQALMRLVMSAKRAPKYQMPARLGLSAKRMAGGCPTRRPRRQEKRSNRRGD